MKLDILETFVTDDDINNGYIDDTTQAGICTSCKDHSCPSYTVDEDGTLNGDYLSDCCGASIRID